MSIHEPYVNVMADARTVRRALDAFSNAVDFLPVGVEQRFVAANCNKGWAHKPSKRLLDLVIAVPALIVLAPLLAFLALLIRLILPALRCFAKSASAIAGVPSASSNCAR